MESIGKKCFFNEVIFNLKKPKANPDIKSVSIYGAQPKNGLLLAYPTHSGVLTVRNRRLLPLAGPQ